ncbi:MAG: hypothetical protein V4643_00120 [Bacteroidota bacterium]
MRAFFVMGSLVALVFVTEACTPNCGDTDTATNYVDQAYLPDIIPYGDTSTARFLRNGTDTLVFKSQGLKETFISGTTLSSDCPKNTKNQQFSLRMAASDTDFFDILFYAINTGVPRVKIKINNSVETNDYTFNSFRRYYPPILQVNILNHSYDTVMKLPETVINEFYLKPKFGLLKVKTSAVMYELIP